MDEWKEKGGGRGDCLDNFERGDTRCSRLRQKKKGMGIVLVQADG